ncbi:MAG TPA: helix-turn-helix domain-containing protein [Lysobacter sp.]|nr:helix-turn-helix domain-containing protein [Lysobacter sp.]
MKGYGQFCPVAMAAALLSERWTLLVVRELLMGSRHFNQLRRGLPLMSPTLLSKRLHSLQEQGVVVREPSPEGGWLYGLTEAGRELFPLIEKMGQWGKRWVATSLNRKDIDVRLLMWAMHREFNLAALPQPRVMLKIDLSDGGRGCSHFWVILDREAGRAELCLQDPGHELDVILATDVVTITKVYIGDTPFEQARISGRFRVQGASTLVRSMPKWFARSLFADTQRQAQVAQAAA